MFLTTELMSKTDYTVIIVLIEVIMTDITSLRLRLFLFTHPCSPVPGQYT
jgi:hypothetical protein